MVMTGFWFISLFLAQVSWIANCNSDFCLFVDSSSCFGFAFVLIIKNLSPTVTHAVFDVICEEDWAFLWKDQCQHFIIITLKPVPEKLCHEKIFRRDGLSSITWQVSFFCFIISMEEKKNSKGTNIYCSYIVSDNRNWLWLTSISTLVQVFRSNHPFMTCHILNAIFRL